MSRGRPLFIGRRELLSLRHFRVQMVLLFALDASPVGSFSMAREGFKRPAPCDLASDLHLSQSAMLEPRSLGESASILMMTVQHGHLPISQPFSKLGDGGPVGFAPMRGSLIGPSALSGDQMRTAAAHGQYRVVACKRCSAKMRKLTAVLSAGAIQVLVSGEKSIGLIVSHQDWRDGPLCNTCLAAWSALIHVFEQKTKSPSVRNY